MKPPGHVAKSAVPDAALLWADMEDHLVPAFALSAVDFVIYASLVRATRLAGLLAVWTSNPEVGRRTLLSSSTVRLSLHRLARCGAVRILECGRRGQRVQVLLPREIPGCVRRSLPCRKPDIDSINFLTRPKFREALYRREKDRCFYCLRRLNTHNRSLDHVIPRVRGGNDSYRNLVTSCHDCNSAKRNSTAENFLRDLRRQQIFTSCQMVRRFSALQKLQSGKLKPQI